MKKLSSIYVALIFFLSACTVEADLPDFRDLVKETSISVQFSTQNLLNPIRNNMVCRKRFQRYFAISLARLIFFHTHSVQSVRH